MSEEGAKKLGERLLAEVEVENLSSLLKTLRGMSAARHRTGETEGPPTPPNTFVVPDLDDDHSSQNDRSVLELVSPPSQHHVSGAGKASLLYLIIANAILPRTLVPGTPLHGDASAIVLIDPLQRFDAKRLAQVMLKRITHTLQQSNHPVTSATKTEIKHVLATSLSHVHIFSPPSWAALIATLRALPTYLFHPTKHKSTHRRVHSIALYHIDAFSWSISDKSSRKSTSLATASAQLTTILTRLSSQFSCRVITTSTSTSLGSWRPVMPVSWPQSVHVTRLAVRRIDAPKVPPMSSVEEVEAERAQRCGVVERGRFECRKIGAGGGGGEERRLVFRVGGDGVEVEVSDGK